jgi:hypothetical protein
LRHYYYSFRTSWDFLVLRTNINMKTSLQNVRPHKMLYFNYTSFLCGPHNFLCGPHIFCADRTIFVRSAHFLRAPHIFLRAPHIFLCGPHISYTLTWTREPHKAKHSFFLLPHILQVRRYEYYDYSTISTRASRHYCSARSDISIGAARRDRCTVGRYRITTPH